MGCWGGARKERGAKLRSKRLQTQRSSSNRRLEKWVKPWQGDSCETVVATKPQNYAQVSLTFSQSVEEESTLYRQTPRVQF